MAATCNWGTQRWTSHWAWRLIIVLQLVIPILMAAGAVLLPESPRWLVGTGKHDQALKVLRLLRRGSPDEVTEREWELLVAAEQEQHELHHATAWADCLRGTNLRRTAIVVGVQCLQQAQGNSFIANYSVVFLQTIGIKDTYKITVLLYFVNLAAAGFAFYAADRLGRRKLLFGAACVMAACMFAVASITGFDSNPESIKGALACLFIWQFAQALGWSSW
jgi:MFS family permease